MSRRRTTFLDGAVGALALCIVFDAPAAWAQACCAGGSAVTPGRLEPQEDELVGATARASLVYGSYQPSGLYVPASPGDSELDLEQDWFAAVRVLGRGQLAFLVPSVQTLRSTPTDGSHLGGGFGDVNASFRYDFILSGEMRYVPGVALLGGITVPTGTPVERATAPLAVDTTGVGALQANAALALEKTFGPWLVNATGIVAQRAPRLGEALATQLTLLAAGAYTFANGAAAALALSYAVEGDARDTADGREIQSSGKSLATVTFSLMWPFADDWRMLGGLLVSPPVAGIGSNQPAAAGLTLTLIRSWS